MSLYVNYGSGQTNMNTSAPHMKVASKYKTYFHSKHFRFSSVVSWAHMDYKTILLWQSNKLQLLFVWLQVIVHLFSSSILILDKKRKRFIFFLQTSIVIFFFFVQWFSCHPRLYPILNLMTSVFYILCLLNCSAVWVIPMVHTVCFCNGELHGHSGVIINSAAWAVDLKPTQQETQISQPFPGTHAVIIPCK